MTGAATDIGPNGKPRTIVGPQTIERTEQLNETVRMGYAFTDHVDATLTLGHWENHYRQHGETSCAMRPAIQSTVATCRSAAGT